MQAEALQQTRTELSQLVEEVQEQLVAMEQLTAERDACKSGAHEASDRSKVCVLRTLCIRGQGTGERVGRDCLPGSSHAIVLACHTPLLFCS